MNVLNLTNKGYSARVFAGITILSLLLSAFPAAFFVANAATPLSGASFTLDQDNAEYTTTVDTTGLENIVLSFQYDARLLDANDPNVTITYSAGTESNTFDVSGQVGDTALAGDTGVLTLPGLASEAALAIAISADVSGFSGAASDNIELTGITVAGDKIAVATPYIPPSTNSENKAEGNGHVELVSATTNDVTLNFINPKAPVMCFEYRTDGDATQTTGTNGGDNYNTEVLDGIYPFFCVSDDSQEETIAAVEYVEIRSVFGAERDWDFDWTRFNVAVPKIEETIVVTGDTAAGENQLGWLFNRDLNNATPIEFNEDESVIGDGALYVLPLSNSDAPRKFIGEYFWQGVMADLDGFSYDFKIGAGGADTDSEEFYLNVYANFGESSPTKYYDCKYDVVPSNGTTAGFVTATFDPTQSYQVTTRGSSPYTCPSVPADMDTLGIGGAVVRAFAINTGDTSLSDADLDGYFDNVVLNTKTKVTTFDFEKGAVDPNDENQLTITGIKFHNRNADHNRDTGEEGLEGWELRLYKEAESTWNLVATGTTNVIGAKKFPQQKSAGTYYVCEVAQLGWTQVAPAEDTQTVNISPNSAEEGPYCTKTTYSDESDRSTKPEIGNVHNDLNNEHQLNISGEVYLDIAVDDCDNRTECLFSKTDTKLADWEMRLYKEVAGIWTEVATATTNDDGIYRFPTQYEAGVYHTCEVLEAGYEQGIGNWNGSGYLVNTANLSGATDEGPYCNTYTYTDAGDKSSKSHFGNAIVDTTNPTVTIKDSSITCEVGQGYEKVNFKLKDLESGIDKVVLNGKETDLSNNTYSDFNNVTPGNWTGAVEGINILEVYDLAGNVTELTFTLCVGPDDESSAPIATVKDGEEFSQTCDAGYRKLSYKLHDADGKIDHVVINGVKKELTDNKWSDVNFLAPGVFGAQVGENTMVVYDTAGNNSTYTFFLCEALVTCEITSGPNTLVLENNEFAVPAYVHRNWTDNIANATWVWPTEYVQNPEQEETFTFEETFSVTDIDNASIEVAADNGYRVIVNGVEVIDRSSIGNNFSDHTILPPIDIAEQLLSGENTVQVEVTNSAAAGSNSRSNPAGVLFKIVINAETACQITTAPNEQPPVEDEEMYVIDGYKYQTEDEGASPKAGWTIYASNGVNAPLSTTTDADGYFYFEVEAGFWTVTEEMRTDWELVRLEQNGETQPIDGDTPSCEFEVREPRFTIPNLQFPGEGEFLDPTFFDGFPFIEFEDREYRCEFTNEEMTSSDPKVPETPENPEDTENTDEEEDASTQNGSRSTGQRFSNRLTTAGPTPFVLGASTVDMCPFIMDYMQIGDSNNALQVTYLQLFLNTFKDLFGGVENPVTGVFGTITDENVKAFQEHYRAEVLDPWFDRGIVPHNRPTGFVYKTTLWKINDLVCPGEVPYPSFEGESLSTNVDNDINEPVRD